MPIKGIPESLYRNLTIGEIGTGSDTSAYREKIFGPLADIRRLRTAVRLRFGKGEVKEEIFHAEETAASVIFVGRPEYFMTIRQIGASRLKRRSGRCGGDRRRTGNRYY